MDGNSILGLWYLYCNSMVGLWMIVYRSYVAPMMHLCKRYVTTPPAEGVLGFGVVHMEPLVTTNPGSIFSNIISLKQYLQGKPLFPGALHGDAKPGCSSLRHQRRYSLFLPTL